MKNQVLVLLQNAWSWDDLSETPWHRPSWLAATEASFTGRRLKRILGNDCFLRNESHSLYFWFDNTTTKVGDCANSRLPTEPEHVARLLANPSLMAVVACGTQAQKATEGWAGPTMHIPHPAYRLWNNKALTGACHSLLDLIRECTAPPGRAPQPELKRVKVMLIPAMETTGFIVTYI